MDALGAEAVELVPSGAGDEAEVPVLVARASSLHTSPEIDIKQKKRKRETNMAVRSRQRHYVSEGGNPR